MDPRYESLRKIVAIAITVVALGCAVGIWQAYEAGVKAGTAAREAKAAATDAKQAIARSDKEGRDRRDQTCTIAERDYAFQVNQLRGTYRYLASLSKAESQSTLNQFVVRNLPQQERRLRLEHPPSFCDKPGIGLPEPNPVLPKHRDFRYLLAK